MNKIVNKLLLAGDKFLHEMHLKQPGFIYSACGSLTKNKEKIQKSKETGDTKYVYRNELDKACFQHDMAYGDFKDLVRRTASDKVLRDEAFNIAKNPKYDGHQTGLACKVYEFFDKKSASLANKYNKDNKDSGVAILKNYTNQLLKNCKKEEFIVHLKTIFGVLI